MTVLLDNLAEKHLLDRRCSVKATANILSDYSPFTIQGELTYFLAEKKFQRQNFIFWPSHSIMIHPKTWRSVWKSLLI